MEKQRKKYIAIRAARYCIANILFVIISFMTYRALYFIAQRTTNEISEDIIRAFHIGLGLITYHILHKAFIITDAEARKAYYNGGDTQGCFTYFIKNPDVLISLLVSIAFFTVFPKAFSVFALQELTALPLFASFAIVFAAFLIDLLIIWLIGLRGWRKVEEEFQKTKTKRKDNRILLKYIGSSLFTFPVLGYVLPIFFPTFRTLPQMLLTLGIVLIPVAICLAFLVFLISYTRAFFIRFGFFKKLEKAAKAYGYTISEIKHPYASIFKDYDGSSFTVNANGKNYACKLLSGIHYGDPMYFEDEGKGVIIRHITLRYRAMMAAPFARNAMIWQKLPEDLAQFRTYFKYSFEGEGKKVLIVSPTPHSIYASGYGQNKLLDVGDVVHGYTLMTGTAFINALRRDCL